MDVFRRDDHILVKRFTAVVPELVVLRRIRLIALTLILCAFLGVSGAFAAPPDGIPGNAESAKVVAITDGDTITVLLEDGTEATVRLIGIDTPLLTLSVNMGASGRQKCLPNVISSNIRRKSEVLTNLAITSNSGREQHGNGCYVVLHVPIELKIKGDHR